MGIKVWECEGPGVWEGTTPQGPWRERDQGGCWSLGGDSSTGACEQVRGMNTALGRDQGG